MLNNPLAIVAIILMIIAGFLTASVIFGKKH